MSKLTPKQEKFYDFYVVNCNATQAAISAGYSIKTASEQAARLLVNVNIQSRIDELRQSQQQRTQVKADLIVKRFWAIANFDIRSVCTFDGSNWQFKPFSEWDESAFNAISITGVTRDGKPQIRSESKLAALDSLGKHLGLFSDFNVAIAVLKTYGISVKRNTDGSWSIDESTGTDSSH